MPNLIETCRVMNGQLPLGHLHVARLAHSCRELGIPFPGSLDVTDGIEDGIVRYEISTDGVETSVRPTIDESRTPERPKSRNPGDPIALVLSDVVHRPYPHKTTSRGQFDDALARAKARDADDGLLLTIDGYVAECAIWSVFWWEDDRVVTPSLELGVLPGVARVRLGQMAGVVERRVGPLALAGRSLFVANAARGVVGVGSLNDRAVPGDPRTDELAARFWG